MHRKRAKILEFVGFLQFHLESRTAARVNGLQLHRKYLDTNILQRSENDVVIRPKKDFVIVEVYLEEIYRDVIKLWINYSNNKHLISNDRF